MNMDNVPESVCEYKSNLFFGCCFSIQSNHRHCCLPSSKSASLFLSFIPFDTGGGDEEALQHHFNKKFHWYTFLYSQQQQRTLTQIFVFRLRLTDSLGPAHSNAKWLCILLYISKMIVVYFKRALYCFSVVKIYTKHTKSEDAKKEIQMNSKKANTHTQGVSAKSTKNENLMRDEKFFGRQWQQQK